MADTPDDVSYLMPPSWLQEYYPTPAAGVATLPEAIAHSLRKWEGLRADVLQKHNVTKLATSSFVDSDSCALCQLVPELTEEEGIKHSASVMQLLESYEKYECIGCPLVQLRGTPCDALIPSKREKSPWAAWNLDGDPEPMIRLLKQAWDEYGGGV